MKTKQATMWQWMDDHFGPMGWFNDTDKRLYEKAAADGQGGFTKGHWRQIPAEEVAKMNGYIGQLAYEQS